ncbi:hypothetical protein TRIUR3_10301 [Triticum urartu]|uniref:Uncharacterized protein n=1 Tax=Triticum urartu TaxID=4572 RepID=M7ZRL6_TRIUA|nr:hypothetical protein TRIUR3_10301 [Triticum urartu]
METQATRHKSTPNCPWSPSRPRLRRLSPPPLAAEAGALVEAGSIPAMVAAQQATLHAQVDQLQRLVVNPLAQEMLREAECEAVVAVLAPWWPSSRRSRRPRARAVVAVLAIVPCGSSCRGGAQWVPPRMPSSSSACSWSFGMWFTGHVGEAEAPLAHAANGKRVEAASGLGSADLHASKVFVLMH